MYDTIIIGAGMSGLAAGIRLAYYDQQVCILERHYAVGGLNSFYRLRGRNYDVGLHAVTNFAPRQARRSPLARIMRQLRFRWEDFALSPQVGSAIRFPGLELRFSNDLDLLRSQIERVFPSQRDNFERLLARIADYDELNQELYEQSTRQFLAEIFDEPLLVEMFLCPVMWYGNAREDDMDFGLFCVLFRSIFLEGLARPFAGVRLILKNLVRRFRQLGGQLKLRSGVARIEVENGRAVGVTLDDGRQLTARRILSSIGCRETLRLCGHPPDSPARHSGRMSFVEAISVLDIAPERLGHDRTMVFFNDSPMFLWRNPEELCGCQSGVICCPNNFLYGDFPGDQPDLHEGLLRITATANYARWTELPDDRYGLEKLRWYDRIIASAVRFMPDFRRHVIDTDVFTPKTIHRFTWHDEGAVYGAPDKRLAGTTHLPNVFLCGTDQGFVGIVGAIISGIAMANRHCLKAEG